MAKHGKRLKAAYATVDHTKQYSLAEAITLIKAASKVKFDETVELSMNLGIDPRHADQMVRGLISLPNGTGIPGSIVWVWALNSLQNCMMFRPR